MKKHWTQTAAGRKRLKEAMTKSWEKRRALTGNHVAVFGSHPMREYPESTGDAHGSRPAPNIIGTSSNSPGINATILLPPVNGGLSTRIRQANTVAELEEIKAFLDLRDELIARLP